MAGGARVVVFAELSLTGHEPRATVGSFIVPSAWEAEAAMLRERAATRGTLVAMANHGAPTGGMNSTGRTSIWDERGELVLQLEPSGPGVGIAVEKEPGVWQAVTRMMSLGSMGLEGVGVGQT